MASTARAARPPRNGEGERASDTKSRDRVDPAEQVDRLEQVYLETVAALAKVVEAKDAFTGAHVERVRGYSEAIGRRLGLDDSSLRQLAFGAVLHDVGKVAIPDRILAKPEPLTPVEWGFVRLHPQLGCRILEGVSFLADALDGIVAHHERWDGSGYPHSLAGHEIPLYGRIVAVADAFDALTQHRPYRNALPAAASLDVICRERGRQFDPEVVDAFVVELSRDPSMAA